MCMLRSCLLASQWAGDGGREEGEEEEDGREEDEGGNREVGRLQYPD